MIHNAVCASEGLDFYTGESLEWEKISSYSNDESKAARSVYKASLARLPTADHVLLEDGRYDFVICGWRTMTRREISVTRTSLSFAAVS